MRRRTIPVSEFKAHCLRLMEQARAGDEIIVTKRGRPLARVTAVSPSEPPPRTRGSWRGRIAWEGSVHDDWSQEFEANRGTRR
jgi:prevent-host-death family protein